MAARLTLAVSATFALTPAVARAQRTPRKAAALAATDAAESDPLGTASATDGRSGVHVRPRPFDSSNPSTSLYVIELSVCP